MTTSDGQGKPLDFAIAPPFVSRVIALAAGVAPLLLLALWFPLKVGPARFFNRSVGWLIFAMLLAPAALFLRLAFPPRSSMARLQIRHDSISLILRGWAKHYFAQPVIEAAITPDSTEILLCQKGLPNGYGVIVRSGGRREQEVYAGATLTLHSAAERQKISEAIAAVTKLPVRLVRRRRLVDGTFEETPWVPNSRNANSRTIGTLGTGALPFLGGIVAGHFMTNPVFLAAIGLALWFIWRFAFAALTPDRPKRSFATMLYSITNLFMFGIAYVLAVVIDIFVFRAH